MQVILWSYGQRTYDIRTEGVNHKLSYEEDGVQSRVVQRDWLEIAKKPGVKNIKLLRT